MSRNVVRLPAEVNRILYVRNLPYKITSEELYDIFGKFGAIRQIRKGTHGDKKGTAFVVYEDIYDAKNAFDNLSGFNVAGRYLIVLYYQPQKMQERQDMEFQRKINEITITMNIIKKQIESTLDNIYQETLNSPTVKSNIHLSTIQAIRDSNYTSLQNLHTKYKKAINIIFEKALALVELEYQKRIQNELNLKLQIQVQLSLLNSQFQQQQTLIMELQQQLFASRAEAFKEQTITQITKQKRELKELLEENEIKQECQQQEIQQYNSLLQELQKEKDLLLKQVEQLQQELRDARLQIEQFKQKQSIIKSVNETETKANRTVLHEESFQLLKPKHMLLSEQYSGKLDSELPTQNNEQNQSGSKPQKRHTLKPILGLRCDSNQNYLLDYVENQSNKIMDLNQLLQKNTKIKRPRKLSDIYLFKNRFRNNSSSVDYYYQTPESYRFNVKQSISSER